MSPRQAIACCHLLPSTDAPTHQPQPSEPQRRSSTSERPKKAKARVPAWDERSKDGTLDRVGVAPAGVTAVQASMAFVAGPPTTRRNARSQPALPTPQAETRGGEINLAGEAQDPAPSPTTMTHHLQKAPLAAADPPTTNAPDPSTTLQAQASHAAAAAGRPRAWAPTPPASHGHGHASAGTTATG